MRDAVREKMALLGVAELGERSFPRLSGGQQQRLLLAGLLATRPNLLVLDEPTDGLDTRSTRTLLSHLRDVRDNDRASIVLVSHDVDDLLELCHDVALVHPAESPDEPATVEIVPDRAIAAAHRSRGGARVSDWPTYRELLAGQRARRWWRRRDWRSAASLLGVFVVLRREGLLALALPQVVAVGAAVGIAARLGLSAARDRGGGRRPARHRVVARRRTSHLLLPALYIGGLSVSVLLIANSAAHLHEIQHLLAGEDVFVSWEQAYFVAPTLIVAGVIAARAVAALAAAGAKPDGRAASPGLRPARWDALFLVLLATVVVVGTSASGILMVLACLFLPAARCCPGRSACPPR